MKKTFFIVATSLLFVACGQQKVVSSSLIQVSEFSIVTVDKDTLYLKDGDDMAIHIKNYWDNGEFRKYDNGNNTAVIVVSEGDFNSLSEKSTKDPVLIQRLSQLANSY